MEDGEEDIFKICGTTSIGPPPATAMPVEKFTGDDGTPPRSKVDKGTRSNCGEPEEREEESEESARSMTPSPVRSRVSF